MEINGEKWNISHSISKDKFNHFSKINVLYFESLGSGQTLDNFLKFVPNLKELHFNF